MTFHLVFIQNPTNAQCKTQNVTMFYDKLLLLHVRLLTLNCTTSSISTIKILYLNTLYEETLKIHFKLID